MIRSAIEVMEGDSLLGRQGESNLEERGEEDEGEDEEDEHTSFMRTKVRTRRTKTRTRTSSKRIGRG